MVKVKGKLIHFETAVSQKKGEYMIAGKHKKK